MHHESILGVSNEMQQLAVSILSATLERGNHPINDYVITDFTCHVTWPVPVVASTIYVLLMMGAKSTRNM
jgi:hypothetical protein